MADQGHLRSPKRVPIDQSGIKRSIFFSWQINSAAAAVCDFLLAANSNLDHSLRPTVSGILPRKLQKSPVLLTVYKQKYFFLFIAYGFTHPSII